VAVSVQQHSLNYYSGGIAKNKEESSMVSAVMLLNTDIDAQGAVIDSLRHVEGVEEAHELYGVYDLLLKVKAQSIDELKDLAKYRIKRVSGVTSALTLMINDPKSQPL
jgi:DNA-binding Lrp family transcriptional regulator